MQSGLERGVKNGVNPIRTSEGWSLFVLNYCVLSIKQTRIQKDLSEGPNSEKTFFFLFILLFDTVFFCVSFYLMRGERNNKQKQ